MQTKTDAPTLSQLADKIDHLVEEISDRPPNVRRPLADFAEVLREAATADTATAVRLIEEAWKGRPLSGLAGSRLALTTREIAVSLKGVMHRMAPERVRRSAPANA